MGISNIIIKTKFSCPKKIFLSLKSGFISTDYSKISIPKFKAHTYKTTFYIENLFFGTFFDWNRIKKYILRQNRFRSKKETYMLFINLRN